MESGPRASPSPALGRGQQVEVLQGAESWFFGACVIFEQVCHKASCLISQLF